MSGRQPRFITKDGFSVQAISLNGVPQYQIKNKGYFVAYARDVAELTQYVDLADLEMEK